MYRQLPHGNQMIKEQAWGSLLVWLHKMLDQDPGAIIATSADKSPEGRHNLAGSIAGFRPDVGSDQCDHKECCLIILREFYRAGLINMKLGKSRQIPLLNCIAKGNIEVARMLLEWGSGFPPWFLPG